MAATVLGGSIEFLAKLGVYDVILPFLLVFSLMFALLEKTKVLGVEEVLTEKGDKKFYTRKSLNSMVAFATAFFVIASSELVRILSEVIANTMILVVTGLCFMLAIGVSHTGQGELDLGKMGKNGSWKKWFWILNAIGILLIFFNALGWLSIAMNFIKNNWNSTYLMTIITFVVFIGFMVWVTGSGKKTEVKKDDKNK